MTREERFPEIPVLSPSKCDKSPVPPIDLAVNSPAPVQRYNKRSRANGHECAYNPAVYKRQKFMAVCAPSPHGTFSLVWPKETDITEDSLTIRHCKCSGRHYLTKPQMASFSNTQFNTFFPRFVHELLALYISPK